MIKKFFAYFSVMIATQCIIVASTYSAKSTAAKPTAPDHLILMVFDQMRPDYIDRYQLKNFQKLRAKGENYPDAYVGHMGAETVVSHFVISTGLPPRELPWQDEVLEDRKNLLGAGENAFYSTGALSIDQLTVLMNQVEKEKLLPTKIKKKFPGAKIFAVGEKAYATVTFGTPQADSIISFRKANGVCSPAGLNLPDYISSNERYTVDCRNAYGTEGSLYPLDGSRSVPGHDLKHLGGDVWVTDVVREVMDRENNWQAFFLTFAGIDKVGHMTGDIDVKLPHSFDSQYSMEEILKVADAQLGRIVEKLKEKNLLERTLIVVTSDHGAQTNTVYLGNGQKSHGGQDLINDKSSPQSYFVEKLLRTGRVRVTYQDTAMRVWLNEAPVPSSENQAASVSDQQVIRIMSETSGLVEIYRLTQNKDKYVYKRVFQDLSRQTPTFRKWAKNHNQELVDTMATDGAPDLIGLLSDGYGFDLLGDHGGAQEHAQRIPMILRADGLKPGAQRRKMRLMDLNKRISEIMGL